jgi:hypothetical protein
MDIPTLSLAEELFLLAINEENGRLASTYLHYGLAGAMLADLTLLGKVRLGDKRKLVVIDETPTEDPLLDLVFTEILEAERPAKLLDWVNTLAEKRFWKRVPESLIARGVLYKEDKQFLWVFPYAAYPQKDATAKYWIKESLRAIALTSQTGETRRVILLSLCKACQMLNLVFTKDERKMAAKRINELSRGETFGEAVAKTLEEIQSAAAAAVIIAVAS